MVRTLEDVLGRRAKLQFLDEQPGDVPQTWASLDKARSLLGYTPATSFRDGIERFTDWLLSDGATDRLLPVMSDTTRRLIPDTLIADESVTRAESPASE